MEYNITSYSTENYGNSSHGNLTSTLVEEEIDREGDGGMTGVQIVYTIVGVLAFVTVVLALANLYVWYRTRKGNYRSAKVDGLKESGENGGEKVKHYRRTRAIIIL